MSEPGYDRGADGFEDATEKEFQEAADRGEAGGTLAADGVPADDDDKNDWDAEDDWSEEEIE